MDLADGIRLLFVGLTAGGGGVGLARLFYVKNTNKHLDALAQKTGVEATAIFSDSVLKMLQNAQNSAERATQQAEQALSEAERCKEELAYLRRWIISQGLVPPAKGFSY